MRRISVYADIEVLLEEVDTNDLIDALEERTLTPRERAKLVATLKLADPALEEHPMERAEAELIAGRREEALVWLERALPHIWRGNLAR